MNVFFRVNSSKEIGAGHFARCSYLAHYLDEKTDYKTLFISNYDGFTSYPFIHINNQKLIKFTNEVEDAEETIKTISAYKHPRILVVDSYIHGEEWERLIRPHVDCLLVIDDLANRKHVCDVLVDCGPQRILADYQGLVPGSTKLLLGLDYCPISLEFQKAKGEGKKSDRIHLFFGSSIEPSVVFEYYRHLTTAHSQYGFNVALSKDLTMDEKALWDKLKREQDELFIGKNLVESLRECSVAIGAPGLATWERAFLQIEGLYIATNENQVQILKDLEKMHFSTFIGRLNDKVDDNVMAINTSLKLIKAQADKAFSQKVDGLGLQRILEAMKSYEYR